MHPSGSIDLRLVHMSADVTTITGLALGEIAASRNGSTPIALCRVVVSRIICARF